MATRRMTLGWLLPLRGRAIPTHADLKIATLPP